MFYKETLYFKRAISPGCKIIPSLIFAPGLFLTLILISKQGKNFPIKLMI